jgi:hypothetical protein
VTVDVSTVPPPPAEWLSEVQCSTWTCRSRHWEPDADGRRAGDSAAENDCARN